ncbi:MAG: exodeoxyribonuclease V subunit alpha, partial [Desulfobacterales bacterium]
MNKRYLTPLYDMGNFNKIDIHFAGFIAMLAKENDPDIGLASALVSQVTGDGDVCLDLRTYAGKTISSQEEGGSKISCPELPIWRAKLIACPAIGPPGEKRPLILDQKNRLYLFRYWEYEHNLVEAIQKKAQRAFKNLDYGILKESLRRLFPDVPTDRPDRQKLGAIVAALRNLCVISGGPGTGKTTTIAQILAVLLEQSRNQKLRIYLAAPTGKASARMAEAIQAAKQKLNCHSHIKDLIPREASTIHRLLKSIPDSPYFYHNAERPLPADLVVVDEASMVDLALMSKLVMALSDDTRLVLVGDKDQLASVEAGSVLGDICGHNAKDGFANDFYQELDSTSAEKFDPIVRQCHEGRGLHDCIVLLKNSYRFAAESGIGGVNHAVNQGNFESALSL